MDQDPSQDIVPPASHDEDASGDSFDDFLRQAAGTSEPASPWPGEPLELGRVLGGRFDILRVIGSGGMGVVHEAFDRERGCKVALKTLLSPDPAGVYLLKNEFRSLADLRHPALVGLHGLFYDDELWFFTMDLVTGCHFDEWVRPGGTLNEARLRDAIPQLAAAVAAIHANGKVHRDLKPSNVIVTPEGRLFVLDFGLAVSLEYTDADESSRITEVSGTPAYMSPEQAGGRRATTASDCYTIGVMLFEALTGTLPFRGPVHEVMRAKQRSSAPSARELDSGVPADLDVLCTGLLSVHPESRPDAQALEQCFRHGDAHEAQAAHERDSRSPEAGLVGREDELEQLRDAYRLLLAGHSVAVFVRGESGIGKTALIRAFLAEIQRAGLTLTLRGRCYERESVPYKALDPIIDELSRYLEHLDSAAAEALLPRDVFALTRLFPVLNRVSSIARASKNTVADLQELRRRGFTALHELLQRISERRPVLVSIDDLQWIDGDSTAFLRFLWSESRPLNVMFVLCARSVEAAYDDALRPIAEAAHDSPRLRVSKLPVGPLPLAAAQALTQRLLAGRSPPAADRIPHESQGSPFFLQQLCRLVRDGGTTHTLQGALAEHFARISPPARGLLEVIAMAGRPVRESIAMQAVDAHYASIDELRMEQLIRSATSSDVRTVECYHDKIRESVVAAFDSARSSAVHRRLLGALQSHPDVDHEQLAIHAEGAGELGLAAEHAVLAADEAHAQLAFARAVELYRGALSRLVLPPNARIAVELKLAIALSNAGRGAEAAPIFHHAANHASPSDALEWRRRAAEQWLVSGRAEEGLRAFAEILEEVGLRLPRSPWLALLDLLKTRLVLRLRGLAFRKRSEAELEPAVLLRVDACKTAWSLSFVSTIRAAALQARHLLYALRAGEPYRISLGLCMEAVYVSLAGTRREKQAKALLKAAHDLSADLGNPHASAFLELARGQTSYMLARYDEASEAFAAAERMLTEQCSNVTWELNSTRFFWGNALEFRGRLRELRDHINAWLIDADARGDLYASATLELLRARLMLAGGDIAAVRETIASAMGRWRAEEFGVQQFLAVITEAQADRYEGDAERARARIREMWPSFSRSLMSRIQICRIPAHQHAAYAALAMAAQRPREPRWLREAAAHQRSLLRERTPVGAAFARQINSAIVHLEGKHGAALHELEGAANALDALNLHVHAAASRRHFGELGGTEAGAQLVHGVDRFFADEGVADPRAYARLMAPGF